MTIAVTQGPKRAAELAAAFFVVAVLLSVLGPIFDQRVSLFYYPIVVLADLGFLYSSYRLIRDPTATTVRMVKSQVLVWMLLGLVGFFVGGIPALWGHHFFKHFFGSVQSPFLLVPHCRPNGVVHVSFSSSHGRNFSCMERLVPSLDSPRG